MGVTKMQAKEKIKEMFPEIKMKDEKIKIKFEDLKIEGIGTFEVQSPKEIKEAKLIFEHVEYDTPLLYKLFEFKFGVGQNTQFLIIPPNMRIPFGESKQYISPFKITKEDEIYDEFPFSEKILKDIASCFGVNYKNESGKKTNKELWEDILLADPVFFKSTSPLSEESLEKLKKSDNEVLSRIIDYYLSEGNAIDDRIMLVVKSQFLDYDKNIAKPEHIMPYNLHSIIVTNTKTTKSTIYEKIGEKRDRVSMAGALGFSTGNETNEGDLNGIMGSYAVDEVQETHQTNVIQQTLTAMETGKVAVSVGKQTVRTNTCASLTFLTNPKELSTSSDLDPKRVALLSFRRVLEILTDNCRAFGSRIGCVPFGDNFVVGSGSRLDYKTFEGIKAIVESIKREVATEFTKIMLNPVIHEWMNCELPAEYIARINGTCKKIPINAVKEFWEGHINSFRHIRGGAVKRACLDMLLDIWNKNYDIQSILKKSESYFTQILDMNIKSLGEMTEMSEGCMDDFIDNLMESIRPDYLKCFLLTMSKYIEINPSKENYIIFDELKGVFDKIENKEEIFGTKYSRWSDLRSKFEEVRQTIQTKLLNDFGIQYTKIGDTVNAFLISNISKFGKISESKLFKKIIFSQSDGVNGVNGVNGVGTIENITPKTPKTPITPPILETCIDFTKLKLTNND